MLSVLVALAVAAPFPAASTNKPKSLQEKVLSMQATGNFACRVNEVTVSTDNPGEEDVVGVSHVRAAFQQVATLEWAHAPQMSFSSMDGRNPEKVLATPGGDMGEFIQAIMAYAATSKADLDQKTVDDMLTKYLKTMTREKFFYETDEKSYMKLAIATGCRNLRIADMGGMKRKKEALLAQVGNPDYIGDPFIKFLATNGTDLGLDVKYVAMGLSAFHTALWGPMVNAEKICYQEFKGAHREAALVTIKVPPYCIDQGLVPMISQQMTCPAPVYIHHPDAAKLLRREMVAVLSEGQSAVNPRDFLAQFNMIAENNFASWWGSVGAGKGEFTVSFNQKMPNMAAVEE